MLNWKNKSFLLASGLALANPTSFDFGLIFPRIHGDISDYYQMKFGGFGAINLPSASNIIRKGEIALIYGEPKIDEKVIQLRGSAFLLGDLGHGIRIGPSLQFWMLKSTGQNYLQMSSGETDFGVGGRAEFNTSFGPNNFGLYFDENIALTLPKRTWISSLGIFWGFGLD